VPAFRNSRYGVAEILFATAASETSESHTSDDKISPIPGVLAGTFNAQA
jgi:hypothetical protein